jgi:hypothetical protein
MLLKSITTNLLTYKRAVAVCRLQVMLVPFMAGCAVAAEWADMRLAGPFVCRADFSLNDVDPLLTELTRLQDDLTLALNIPPAKDSIQIYLFHDRRTYEAYLSRYFPNVPFRRAIYIKGGGPGMVFAFRSPQFEVDLRHECTHALLHASLNNLPLWLDEGLAVYFELPAKLRAGDSPNLAAVRRGAWLGMVPDIEHLEKCNELSQMGKVEYRDSWAWVFYMLHGPTEAHEELMQYLRDLQTQNTREPLNNRLASRIPDLQKSFARFFKNWKTKS